MRIFLIGLLAVSTITLALAQSTYDIGGVSFTDAELEAYQSAVVTQANQIRSLKDKAQEALRFFDALDQDLFTQAEKDRIAQAKTVIRLACKRQIDSIGADPVTPSSVKEELLEKAVASGEQGAQAQLDALRGGGK